MIHVYHYEYGGKGPHFYCCHFYIYIEILDNKHGEAGVSILVTQFRIVLSPFFPSLSFSLFLMGVQCSRFDQPIYLSWGYLQNVIEHWVEIECLHLHKRTSWGTMSIPQVLVQLWNFCFHLKSVRFDAQFPCFFLGSAWVALVGGRPHKYSLNWVSEELQGFVKSQ